MNGHANIDTEEATEHLRNMLKLGKSDTDSAVMKTVSNGNIEASGDGNISQAVPYQRIDLLDGKDCSHVDICGAQVDIYSSRLEHGASCSQVIVEDIIDYGWEEKYYTGQLISIHVSGLYYAYVLKPPNKPGFVRVYKTHLHNRSLIKDYKSEVKDIAFAHSTARALLGSVDACGEMLIHEISDDGTAVICNLLLRILRPDDWTPCNHNRLIWCLYIPDESEPEESEGPSEDVSTLLVVTHNERAEIWNIETILKTHNVGNLTVEEVNHGVQVISDLEASITSATFSPDGTALAIGSSDGIVKFFQVSANLEKKITPRCLHHWSPHPEKSLSSLYFLDNYKNHRPEEQFWKIAVTGADNNTEIKVWSCESWACLQTIRIHPNPKDTVMPCLKADIDLSSKYLFLSDLKRKVLLVFYMEQDTVPLNIIMRSVSEYRVPLPILSLTVVDITYSKLHPLSEPKEEDDDEDQYVEVVEMDDMNKEENVGNYIIKLLWIQRKSLQSCRLIYKAKTLSPQPSVDSVSSISQDSFIYKDGLSDLSMDSRDASNRSIKDVEISMVQSLSTVDELPLGSPSTPAQLSALPPHISSYPKCAEVLLTPDDFTSSPSHSNLTAPLHEDVSASLPKCDITPLSEAIDSLPIETGGMQRRKSSQHSATSSPSREVAEILAPAKVFNLDDIVNEASSAEQDIIDASKNDLESYNLSRSTPASRTQHDYRMKEWPQPPDPTKEYRLSLRSENEPQNHMEHFPSDAGNHSVYNDDLNNKVSQISTDVCQKMDAMYELYHKLNCSFQSVQDDLKVSRQDQKLCQTSTSDNIKKLELTLNQNLEPHYTKLEKLALKVSEEGRQRSQRELALMSEEISRTFSNKLENTLKQELSNNMLPQINRVLDTVAQKIQLDFNQRLSTTDVNLRDSFTKHLKGKTFTDNISQTLASSLHGVVQSACKDVFQSSVVPSFDKSCTHLFQQLNEQFAKGTLEYVQSLEKLTQKSSFALDNAIERFKTEVNTLVTSANQTIQAQAAKADKQRLDMIKQNETLVTDIRLVIQEEVRKALREQTTAVLNSRSTTPVPHADRRLQIQQILHLAKQNNFNDAFQMALSAMDIQLVLCLCEKVNIDEVFGPVPCPLEQHVLLSLISQLSQDLHVKTDIKVKYIEHIIASLDVNSKIIKEHLKSVLQAVQNKLTLFTANHPSHKFSHSFKMITLAINSLINLNI